MWELSPVYMTRGGFYFFTEKISYGFLKIKIIMAQDPPFPP